MIFNEKTGEPVLVASAVLPKVTQQIIYPPQGADGISQMTIFPIPNNPITLIIPSWATGVTVDYNHTTYSSGSYISMYATESIYINFPAAGATVTLNGTTTTLSGTQAVVTIFSDTILNFTSASHADIASMAGIGAKVPVQYIFRAWEAYAYCLANFSGFAYQDILILDNATEIVVGLLRSNFTVQSYDDSTGAFTASGWYRCSYAKSTGAWTFSNYASTTSPSGDTLANAVFTDGTLTYSSSTVFPTNKKAGGGGGGNVNIFLCLSQMSERSIVTINGTDYVGPIETVVSVPSGASIYCQAEFGASNANELYVNGVHTDSNPSGVEYSFTATDDASIVIQYGDISRYYGGCYMYIRTT